MMSKRIVDKQKEEVHELAKRRFYKLASRCCEDDRWQFYSILRVIINKIPFEGLE